MIKEAVKTILALIVMTAWGFAVAGFLQMDFCRPLHIGYWTSLAIGWALSGGVVISGLAYYHYCDD